MNSVKMNRHLPNAPVTEALIDIQVLPKDGLSFLDIEKTFSAPDFGYYVKGPISESTFAFGVGSDGQPLPSSGSLNIVGLRLHSLDEKYVLQVRPERLTLSRLTPYETWEILESETKRLWNIFVSLLKPIKVVRIATRFINNLKLPIRSGESFQKYIEGVAEVPPGTPQAVEAFVQRFQTYEPTVDARVILTLSLDGVGKQGAAPVILDIDAFKLVSLEPGDPYIWNELDNMRRLKDDSFFGVLTESALELYK